MDDERVAAATEPGPRRHDIGRGGAVTVTVEAGDVRIHGTDGTEARVVAPADGAGIETEARPGCFTVRTLRSVGKERTGFVGIQIGRRGFGFPLSFGVSGTIEIEVPRDARVDVRAAAGDIAVRDVRGGTTVKTASGDVSIKRAGGRVAVDVASGDVHVTADESIALEARSMSGDVRARAPRFERVAVETVSGDVELAGAFAPAQVHAISTVSGDVEVALIGGLTVEVRTVSGSVECTHPDRREGGGRKRALVVGDGAARLAVRSMSGDIEVRAGKPDVLAAAHARPTPVPGGPDGALGSTPEQAGPDGALGSEDVPATASPAPPGAEVTQVAPAEAAPDEGPRVDPAILAVLEALAGGEIDVGEAERRLAGGGAVAAAPDADGAAPDARGASPDA
jgi:hypothetical protein